MTSPEDVLRAHSCFSYKPHDDAPAVPAGGLNDEELEALASLRQRQEELIEERDSFQRIGIATGLELEHAIEAVNEGAAINDGLRETVSELETEAASLRTQLQQAETALRWFLERYDDELRDPTGPMWENEPSRTQDAAQRARNYFAAPPPNTKEGIDG